ncbi:hypothetical protein EVJ58_g4896 [Rhodofomes roseus]|uniref:Uncharacterized protein n=1 Tax=Rhodofomes roseus TaxID=34475 RepID=A0A4Y9YG53_9APHY|nr:hypothetical protein EVJ58_g4896 [Rhodofomes roseus]
MANPDVPPPYSRLEDTPPCYDPEKALAEFNALSSDEKAKVSVGVAQAASRDDAASHFEEAANAAAEAADKIDTMFVTLTAKLISLQDTEDFVKEFGGIKGDYRVVVSDSHDLAISIAQYAESFDDVVVKFCADDRLTVERRKEKIDEFIKKSEGIHKDAKAMEDRFTKLTDRFSVFVGSFSTWAKAREEADQEKIKQLLKEIGDIDEQLSKIQTAIYAISAALAVTLPVTGILAVVFLPAAPWIMGIGCVIAGVELGSLTGLLIAQNILLNDKRTKENQIKDLQDEISKIKAARTQLEEEGQADLLIFTSNIKAIAGIWNNVKNNATEIKKWLEDGAKDADVPEYMKLSLEKAVKVYSTMAQYLKNYANGVKTKVESFKA